MDGWKNWLGGLAGAVVGAIFTPPLLVALGTVIFLFWMDFFSGAVAGQKNGKPLNPETGYSGNAGRGGWKRKTNTIILILSVAVLQAMAAYLGNPELAKFPGATLLAAGFAAVELMSIVRNALLAGADLPYLKKMFGIDDGPPPAVQT
jgi:hypothetical protein